MEIVTPKTQQIKWANCEIGAIIHFDLETFIPYDFRDKWGWNPDLSIFDPKELDTDQWIKTAVSAGAKYVVLVAKHCTGFCLWNTKAYDYNVSNTPFKNGKVDIVAEFIKSCKKYDVKPGLYYSCACNGYLGVDNPGTVVNGTKEQQENYNKIVIQQLTELWSNYGELFEIWFDGGTLPVEKGGPDVVTLLKKLQPNALVFQGPNEIDMALRWIGNETGTALDDCWATMNIIDHQDNSISATKRSGNPFGEKWMSAECDMPNRDASKSFAGGWFWKEGEDNSVLSASNLLEKYEISVGRNCNLLLGMVIDNRGLVPKKDAEEFEKFGNLVKEKYNNPLAIASGENEELILCLAENKMINAVVICEDIKYGERVLDYTLEGFSNGKSVFSINAHCIGHKRIFTFDNVLLDKIRLKIKDSKDTPKISFFAII